MNSGSNGGQDGGAQDLGTGIGGVGLMGVSAWCDSTIGCIVAEYYQVIGIIDVYLLG